MANFFDSYEYDLNDFNVRFGLNFSFDEFATSQYRLDNMASAFNSDGTSIDRVNKLYKSTLLKLYREYVENAMLGRSDSSEEHNISDNIETPKNFVQEFEEIMNIYRAFCEEKKMTPPASFGGIKDENGLINDMRAMVSEIRGERTGMIDKTEYVKQQYLAGKMPLRKIRAELDRVKEEANPSSVSVGKLINKMRAIGKANAERSFLSKLNPLNWPRMYAENRDYAAINNFLVDYNAKQPESYVIAVERADSLASLDAFDESLDLELEKVQARETEKVQEKGKTKMSLPDLDERKTLVAKGDKDKIRENQIDSVQRTVN